MLVFFLHIVTDKAYIRLGASNLAFRDHSNINSFIWLGFELKNAILLSLLKVCNLILFFEKGGLVNVIRVSYKGMLVQIVLLISKDVINCVVLAPIVCHE